MSEETRITDGPLQRIPIGTRLSGLYQIDSLLGIGGMGEVYRGHAIETQDEVAIKTILPEFAQNEAALALFRKEASSLHNLYHEAIVRYFVFTIDRDLGIPFLAMEYVEGESLSDILKRGPLSFEETALLTRRLASGLQAAHERGIVHRDISPDNIILPGGRAAKAKIIDFGIARSPVGGKTVIGGGFAGKFSYVSPEQLGLHGGDVTGQSDIYSLGLVLAQCLLGRVIDMGSTHIEVIEKRRGIPDLTGADPRLKPLLERMLEPDPAKRIATMGEVEAWAPELPVAGVTSVAPGRVREASGPSGGRSRMPLVAAAAAGVLALGGLGALFGTGIIGGGDQRMGRDLTLDDAKLPEGPALAGTNVGRKPSDPPPREAASPPASTSQPGASQPGTSQPTSPPPATPPPAATATGPAPGTGPSGRVPASGTTATPPSGSPPGQPPTQLASRNESLPGSAAPTDTAAGQDATALRQRPGVGGLVASGGGAAPQTPPGPSTPPVSPSSGLTMEEVAAFIRQYRGGDCFFVSPASVSAREATIEGMGVSTAPFVRLESDFKSGLGFEPKITLNQVTQPQCPVIDLVGRQAAARRSRAPRITLRQDVLKSGQELAGTADAGGDPQLELLVVADDGRVFNITSSARRTGDGASFALRLDGAPNAARPQLLLAVTSQKPIASLKNAGLTADKLVRDLAEESSRSGSPLGMALKYFKLGG